MVDVAMRWHLVYDGWLGGGWRSIINRLNRWCKDVSFAIDVANDLSPLSGIPKFAAQAMHQPRQAHLADVAATPGLLNQRVLANQFARLAAETAEHPPLQRREGHELFVFPEEARLGEPVGVELVSGHGVRMD